MSADQKALLHELANLHAQMVGVLKRLHEDAIQLAVLQAQMVVLVGRLCEAEQHSRDAGGPLIPPVNPPGPPCILRIADVVERVGLGRSSVWRMVKEHQFPRPRRLSPNTVGWLSMEIDNWLRHRPQC